MTADADLFASGFHLPDQLKALRAELRHGNIHLFISMAIPVRVCAGAALQAAECRVGTAGTVGALFAGTP